jgi:hypothetical protein
MSDIAIRVENLSKQYRIGVRQAAYRTLREALTDAAVAPFRRRRNSNFEFRNPKFAGMYVRLAFAVAARLEPEILLVDESPP